MTTLSEELDAIFKAPRFCRMTLPEDHPDAVWVVRRTDGSGEWMESDVAFTKRIKEALSAK